MRSIRFAAFVAAMLVVVPEFALADTTAKPVLQPNSIVIAGESAASDVKGPSLMQMNF